MRRGTILAGVAAGAAALAMGAFPPGSLAAAVASALQQPSPSEQPPPSPQAPQENPTPPAHKIKVWTNEDLIATRTPADIYMFAKEAQTAADQAEAMQGLMSCFAFGPQQGTVDDTVKAIQEAARSVNDSEAAVAQAQKELQNGPDNLKARNQAELDHRTAELEKARQQLADLEDRLRKLNSQGAEGAPSEQPPTPPQHQ